MYLPSTRLLLVHKVQLPVPVAQCIFPRNPPLVCPCPEPLKVPAGSLRLPPGHPARRVVHLFEICVGEADERLPQVFEAVADVVPAGAMVCIVNLRGEFLQLAVHGCEEGLPQDIL